MITYLPTRICDFAAALANRQGLTLFMAMLIIVSVMFGAARCSSTDYWANKSHLRNWEKLTLYGGQAEIEGRWPDAESCFRQASQEGRNTVAISSQMLASSQKQLAEVLLAEGKILESIDCFNSALSLYEKPAAQNKNLKKEDSLRELDFADCLAGLAEAKRKAGNLQEAKQLYKRALAAYSQDDIAGGLNLLCTERKALCLAGFAQTLRKLGEARLAALSLQQAAKLVEKNGCPKTRADILALANSILPQASADGTLAPDRAGLPNGDAAKRQEQWQTAWESYRHLWKLGDYQAAAVALTHSYAISTTFGSFDLRRDASATQLGILFAMGDRWDLALPYLLETVAIKKHLFGPEDEALVLPMNRLAMGYLHTGDLVKARFIGEAALVLAHRYAQENQRSEGRVLRTLGTILLAQHKPSPAMKMLTQALSIAQETEDYMTIEAIYENLATYYQEKQHYGIARDYLVKAWPIAEEQLGYKEQLAVLTALADVCSQQCDYKSADNYYCQAEEVLLNLLDSNKQPELASKMTQCIFSHHITLLKKIGKYNRVRSVQAEFKRLNQRLPS